MAKAGKRFYQTATVTSVIIILLLGCAKSIRPPGGPIDRTPPQVMTTSPVSGSVEVPLDSRITIKFSEAIDRQTVEKALFISPQIDPEPKVKIKSDAVIIEPRQGLMADKTYVVTIGTDLRDAHRVNLEQSISIAFSTGNTIDSGSIAGAVFRKGRGSSGVSLALFEEEPEVTGLPIDSLNPAYITQSGDGGLYTFNYLPLDTFYLVAFEDKNKNRRINPVREMIGLPYNLAALNTKNVILSKYDIQLQMFDSATLGLRSVVINPDRLLKVRFNKPLERFQADSLIALAVLVRETETSDSVEITDYTNLESYPTSDFIFLTAPMMAGESYRLSFDIGILFPQVPDSLRALEYTFEVPELKDENPPVLMESIPSDGDANVLPDSSMVLHFSEPLNIADIEGAFSLVGADEDTVLITMAPRDKFTLGGRPDPTLDYGADYSLLIDAPRLSDMVGNKMSDSLIELGFSTVGRDTLGQLSGEVQFSKAEDAVFPVVLSFNPARAGEPGGMTLLPGQTQFVASLIPGHYTVSAYLDRNRNGQYDYGSIIPYRLAESFTTTVDTFRVRTRFESAGIVLQF